jgi:hypothetical protein
MKTLNTPEYADEKAITRQFGLGHTSLFNLRKAGKIRSVSTRSEGMSRGKRLFHVQSVRDYLLAQEASESNQQGEIAS